ncbi:MAG: hypothetical protein HY271_14405 [Deltaproteobacteria bacterium]|nr:hypothetical protein [Deltaproteobacteria bacterium]
MAARHISAGTFILAVALAVASAAYVSAYDWTDADCSHWDGTPQHAECVQAHERLAASDCGKWFKGEKEFIKCQHAHNIARVQQCQRGELGNTVGNGQDIVTIACPLANERTGVIEGEQPVLFSDAPIHSFPPEEAHIQPPSSVLPTSVLPTQSRGAAPVRIAPDSWSNILGPLGD